VRKSKIERIEQAGWKVGSAQDFVGLSDEETALIEMKLALAQELKKRREARDLTQHGLAKQLGSSQSRVAKMEAAEASVSLELLIRSVLALGATRQDVGRIIGRKESVPAA